MYSKITRISNYRGVRGSTRPNGIRILDDSTYAKTFEQIHTNTINDRICNISATNRIFCITNLIVAQGQMMRIPIAVTDFTFSLLFEQYGSGANSDVV